MKKTWKLCVLLLSMLLLTTSLPVYASSDSTDDAPVASTPTPDVTPDSAVICALSVAQVTGKPGETIDVLISVEASKAVATGNIVLNYDSSALEVKSLKKQSIVSEASVATGNHKQPGKILLAFANHTPTESTGGLWIVRFIVKSTAAFGTSDITIDSAETSLSYLVDNVSTPFEVKLNNGSVEIIDFIQDMSTKIEALPKPSDPVTFDHQDDIKKAYEAFASATEEERQQLSEEVIEILETARQAYNDLFGDPTEDDSIDASDALLALQHSVELTELGDHPFLSSDVSGDGKVDAVDALFILQFSVKLIDSFPTYIPGI